METKNENTIVDVRTPEEFNNGHIEGAKNIPLDQLTNRMDEIKEMPTPIITYCQSGNRSGMAISILKQHGINEVKNGGGIDDMKNNNY